MLAVVRQAATNRQGPVQLLYRDDPCQLVRQRGSTERQRICARPKDTRVDSLRSPNHKRRLLWSSFLEVADQFCQSLTRHLFAIPIERHHGPTYRCRIDAIRFALTDLRCGPSIERFILDDHNIELGEFGDARLVIGSRLSKSTPRTPDDDKPKRGYASRWSSPTSGRSRMLSRADHLS